MKETPPCLARAMASFSPETDCMIAETMGMFMVRGQASSPLRYLTSGFEADSRGDALRRGIAGDEQILAEGTGRFTKIIRHFAILLYPFRCLICLLVIVPHSRTICKICCIKSFFGLLGKSCINCTMARHKSMTNQNILHIGTRPPFGTGSKRVPACRTCDALFPAHSSKFRVISPSAASRITALAALLLAL